MSPRTGRPKIDKPKTERLYIRIAPEDKRAIQNFTNQTGYSLLELIKIGIETIKRK